MGTYFATFDSTPANLVADLRAQILNSTDWSRPNAATYPNLVKATTTAGAQMAIQLDDAAATSKQMQMGVYRTHDGTTGVDKITRYLMWRHDTAGATSDPVHCAVSAGKEHLYFSIEGPRAGESSPEAAGIGSYRQGFFIGAITPYFAADTVAAVVCISIASSLGYSSSDAYVSRNQADNASWAVARLGSICAPVGIGSAATTRINALQPYASDDSRYLWPYVVVEDDAGLRGRIAKLHFAGYNFDGSLSTILDPVPVSWGKVSYDGDTYILQAPNRACSISQSAYQAFGQIDNANTGQYLYSPIIAVPYSTP